MLARQSVRSGLFRPSWQWPRRGSLPSSAPRTTPHAPRLRQHLRRLRISAGEAAVGRCSSTQHDSLQRRVQAGRVRLQSALDSCDRVRGPNWPITGPGQVGRISVAVLCCAVLCSPPELLRPRVSSTCAHTCLVWRIAQQTLGKDPHPAPLVNDNNPGMEVERSGGEVGAGKQWLVV